MKMPKDPVEKRNLIIGDLDDNGYRHKINQDGGVTILDVEEKWMGELAGRYFGFPLGYCEPLPLVEEGG